MKRTDYCGALRERDIGRIVTVMGWAQNKRDMGGVIFIDLRDREGALQVVFDPKTLGSGFYLAEGSAESVIAVTRPLRGAGRGNLQPQPGHRHHRAGGADSLELLSKAEPLPFSMEDAGLYGRRCGFATVFWICAAPDARKPAFSRQSTAARGGVSERRRALSP